MLFRMIDKQRLKVWAAGRKNHLEIIHKNKNKNTKVSQLGIFRFSVVWKLVGLKSCYLLFNTSPLQIRNSDKAVLVHVNIHIVARNVTRFKLLTLPFPHQRISSWYSMYTNGRHTMTKVGNITVKEHRYHCFYIMTGILFSVFEICSGFSSTNGPSPVR